MTNLRVEKILQEQPHTMHMHLCRINLVAAIDHKIIFTTKLLVQACMLQKGVPWKLVRCTHSLLTQNSINLKLLYMYIIATCSARFRSRPSMVILMQLTCFA